MNPQKTLRRHAPPITCLSPQPTIPIAQASTHHSYAPEGTSMQGWSMPQYQSHRNSQRHKFGVDMATTAPASPLPTPTQSIKSPTKVPAETQHQWRPSALMVSPHPAHHSTSSSRCRNLVPPGAPPPRPALIASTPTARSARALRVCPPALPWQVERRVALAQHRRITHAHVGQAARVPPLVELSAVAAAPPRLEVERVKAAA